MKSEIFVIFLAIIALTYLVFIPMIRNIATFGLEGTFEKLKENQLSNPEVAKLILTYNMRCLGGITILILIYMAAGIAYAIMHGFLRNNNFG